MSAVSALHGATSTILSNLFVKLPTPPPTLPSRTKPSSSSWPCAPREGPRARRDLLASTGRDDDDAAVEVWPLDMDDYTSIRTFAARAETELTRLDGVLANAGIMTRQFQRGGGGDGHERTLNVNVIGTFLLCLLLLPKMRASGRETGWACRFVVPNSALHYLAPVGELEGEGSIIERLDDPDRADMAGRYMVSKLLVLYAVRELAERCRASGKGAVVVNTPNPSYCVSGLARESEGAFGVKTAERLLARTTEEGSRTLFHGLVAGEESHGAYLTNCHVQT
ncbi:hypothetical protein NEMBOFW57_010806 [Staphylotrichum longicolle]|uniref:Uncharacterized protein n=1 Tax=Staphylotrichum longicolle TaxID=669026 RepID=A0AAD4HXC7_9PEZI|nr:hypothetical protein NEMBOFW57_010806 [Staphylotrichum longicolle]